MKPIQVIRIQPDCPACDLSKLEILDNPIQSDTEYIFIGSWNCLRHRPYMSFNKIMQAGHGAIFTPSMADFSLGKYLSQIEEAIVALSQERGCKKFVLYTGCQWKILSSDNDFLIDNLKMDHDIDLTIHDGNHLEVDEHHHHKNED